MCGAKGYSAIAQWGEDQDIALMHQLGFTRKPPKLGGIRKVLIALNGKAFEEALTRWAETLLRRPIPAERSPPAAFALDGKSVRGSFDGLEKAVHLLSLLAHESGLTLAQTAVPNGGENKTNEHKTALRLLEGMVLEGRLITGDAMFCQRDLSQQVIDAQGHYLWFVKANQPTLLNDIQAAFTPSVEGAFSPSTAKSVGNRAEHSDNPRQGTWSS
jgi:Transposase DDE domain